ncbi:MAG TPA: hypothetical protein VGE42_08425 [Candidatus Dormibacteraeota bacterium]
MSASGAIPARSAAVTTDPGPQLSASAGESGGDERSLTDHPDGDVVVADAVEQRVRDHSREGAAATIVGQSGSRIRG